MQEDTYKKIKKSLRFEESGEEVYVEIGMKNVPPKIKTKAIIGFLKPLFEEAISQLDDGADEDAVGATYELSAKDTKELEEELDKISKEDFEKNMQEWIQKNHRTSFATDTALDKGQAEGSSQDGELVSTLQDIKAILERMEGASSDAVLGPGTVVNLTSTCAPEITKEDAQTYCRLIREEFDKMMQDYEKRESRTTYARGIGGAPGPHISIPCPPKKDT